jgi:hypothetical protein
MDRMVYCRIRTSILSASLICFNGTGNIQSIAMGHRSLRGSNTRNLLPRFRIFRINKVHLARTECLRRPVYGLIFLFQWKKEPNEEEVEMSCPENLWFANQVIDNSCASLALLNIILNVPDLEIGEHLTQFKQFTMDFSPPVPSKQKTFANGS